MLHSHAKFSLKTAFVALLLPAVVGCLGDGLPWGQLEASMTATFAPSPDRLDDQGRLKTAANYVVDIEEISLGFDAFSLVLAAQGAAGFDPANPPEGYSLCHNGHCHSDSGALVDYEDIALEMAGGSGGARVAVGLDSEPKALYAAAAAATVNVGLTPLVGSSNGLEDLVIGALHIPKKRSKQPFQLE